jgi:hypothetical protein
MFFSIRRICGFRANVQEARKFEGIRDNIFMNFCSRSRTFIYAAHPSSFSAAAQFLAA